MPSGVVHRIRFHRLVTATHAGVSWRTVQRARAPGALIPRMHVAPVEKIRTALQAEGIEFLQNSNGQGVRLRRR